MYNGLFNEKHFIAPVDIIDFKVKKLIPSGFYDSNILCNKCDNEIIGSLENYSKIVFYGGKGKAEYFPKIERKINQLNQKYLHLINIDYCKFKLFLLSILWRASISKQKFFESVNLGEHESIIGKMIYDKNPGKSSDYPVGLFILNESKTFPTKMIANPIRIEKNKDLSYLFLLNGLVINFKVQGSGDREFYEHIKIKEDNTMDVFIFDEMNGQEFVDLYLKQKLRYK
jgi:hypothetical protein